MTRQNLKLSVASAMATALCSAGLASVFVGTGWITPTLLGIGCAIAGTHLARLVRLPPWMSAPTGLFAVLMGLTVLYSDGHGLLGVLPTPTTIGALGKRMHEGSAYAAHASVPLQPHPGLIAIVAVGIGMTALVVELCAVTFARAAAAGYPLLILAAVPMIVRHDNLPWWAFVAAASGYILLLAVAHSEQATASPRWRLSLPLGAFSVVAALAITALMPGSSGEGLFTGFGGLNPNSASSNGRSVATVHPFTSLRGQLNQATPTELLRVRTNDPEPFYLRLTTLDRFTDSGWSQSRLLAGNKDQVSQWDDRRLPLDSGVPHVKQRTQVEVRGLTGSPYLPVYANPTGIIAHGDWRWDANTETVFSARNRTGRLSYEFSSQRIPYGQELLAHAAPLTRSGRAYADYIQLPGSMKPEIQGLVNELAPPGRSQVDSVFAILHHFDESNGFVYSERTQTGSSGDALVDFLSNKRGFCEQYASAMAYLVRAAKIPARVAIGFSRGQKIDDGGASITTRDAHAWVEVYFNGLGWVPFDPTPSDGSRRDAEKSWMTQDASPQGSPHVTGNQPSQALVAPGKAGAASQIAAKNEAKAAAEPGLTQQWPSLFGLVMAVLGAVALGAGPAVARQVWRRRRLRRITAAQFHGCPETSRNKDSNLKDSSHLKDDDDRAAVIHFLGVAAQLIAHTTQETRDASAAHAAWDELTDTAYDLGLLPASWTSPTVRWRQTRTPRELLVQLSHARLGESARKALEAIATAQEHLRYAQEARSAMGLRTAVTQARMALLSQASRTARLRAIVWPVSAAERLRHSTYEMLLRWRRSSGQNWIDLRRGSSRLTDKLAKALGTHVRL
ncbi:MAG: transglutaminaseTgpA domain-containing protein [Mycobacteriales bacterium]